jgi:hypothetical protein
MQVYGRIYLSSKPDLGQYTPPSRDAAAGAAAGALAVTWGQHNYLRFTLRSRAPSEERLIIELHKVRDDGNVAPDGTSMIDSLSIEMPYFQHKDRKARGSPPVTVTHNLADGSKLRFTYKLGVYVKAIARIGRTVVPIIGTVGAAIGIASSVADLQNNFANHDGNDENGEYDENDEHEEYEENDEHEEYDENDEN